MKKKSVKLITLIFLSIFFLSSCQVNSITNQSTSSPTDKIIFPTATINIEPSEEYSHPLMGLTYKSNDAIWIFDSKGEGQIFAECSGDTLSPDGKLIASEIDGDIFLTERENCSTTTIRNTPHKDEVDPKFWLNHPDLISVIIDPDFNGASPALINISTEAIINIDVSIPNPASYSISPTNDQIVYFDSPWPTISSLDGTEKETLDPSTYTPRSLNISRMDSPAWSPDGEKIAWIARIDAKNPNQESQLALVIFDLSSKKVTKVMEYMPVGSGGWPPAPVWSPDGYWLIFNTWAQDASDRGFWVVSADGLKSTFIDIPEFQTLGRIIQAHPPLWSPDGTTMIISISTDKISSYQIDVDKWEYLPLDIDGIPMIWLDN